MPNLKLSSFRKVKIAVRFTIVSQYTLDWGTYISVVGAKAIRKYEHGRDLEISILAFCYSIAITTDFVDKIGLQSCCFRRSRSLSVINYCNHGIFFLPIHYTAVVG